MRGACALQDELVEGEVKRKKGVKVISIWGDDVIVLAWRLKLISLTQGRALLDSCLRRNDDGRRDSWIPDPIGSGMTILRQAFGEAHLGGDSVEPR